MLTQHYSCYLRKHLTKAITISSFIQHEGGKKNDYRKIILKRRSRFFLDEAFALSKADMQSGNSQVRFWHHSFRSLSEPKAPVWVQWDCNSYCAFPMISDMA